MKTLWAIEPFNQDINVVKKLHKLILQFVDSGDELEAGYIATGYENELALAFDIPIEERFTVYPLGLIRKIFEKAKIKSKSTNLFVEHFDTLSTTKAVDHLLSHAEKSGSELIVVASHTRHGMKRLILGSFAETIIHRSHKNLLIVNPNTSFSDNISHVFYSSDFGGDEKEYISRAIGLAGRMKAKLSVFHVPKITCRNEPGTKKSGSDKYSDHVNEMCDYIKDQCRNRNVECNMILPSVMGSVSDLAIKAAKKSNADLIVVSAKSGPMTALMGGSITRQIVRASHQPVLILK
jgi:nucleotide-binding universal stress UspA family protein